MYVLNIFLFKCPSTSFTTLLWILYINPIHISNMQFLINSYVYKRLADILWALYIVINSIKIDIIKFFFCPSTCITSLYLNFIAEIYWQMSIALLILDSNREIKLSNSGDAIIELSPKDTSDNWHPTRLLLHNDNQVTG